jgi:(4S)-4-hydroxy-5-phosphonooxypentane-2,3-dione isomerase
MPRFAIIGTVEIASGRMNEFLPLLMAHRARCLKDERGTLNFEVLMPHDDNTKVMLYEVYQDEAAFDAHSKGPSRARLREEAEGMMVKVSGTRGTLRSKPPKPPLRMTLAK